MKIQTNGSDGKATVKRAGAKHKGYTPIKVVILELNRKSKETTHGVSKQGVKVQTNGPNGKATVKRAGAEHKGYTPNQSGYP